MAVTDNVKLHTIIPKMLVEAKSEGIKEFAERVKQKINFPLAVWKVFDNLVAEMTGDDNG